MLDTIIETSRASTPLLVLELVVGVPLILYLTWRLWEFTIVPMLHPERPPELPYTIPWIGHGIEYVKNGSALIDRARIYCGDTREPFALTVGGNKLYFLTESADVASMFKNTVELDFSAITIPLSRMYGISDEGIKIFGHMPPSADQDPVKKALNIPGDQPKTLTKHTSDITHEQVLPGPNLIALEKAVAKSLQTSLSRDHLDPYYVESDSTKGYTTISLWRWTALVLGTAMPEAIFGPKLIRGNMNLIHSFGEFAKHNWKLWYGWKDADNVRKAKNDYVGEIDKYLQIPRAEREPQESSLWSKMETALLACNLPQSDISQRAGMLYWVSNSNPPRLSFWILNNLMFRPHQFNTVKKELAAAIPSPDAPIDMAKLANECPLTNACIDETLRIVTGGSAVRVVTNKKGIDIGGKHIPGGARIFAPPRELHMNERVWPNAHEWQPERWLGKNDDARKNWYKPFGGGTTYCPGRHLAKSTVRLFLAIALARYEIDLEPGQTEVKRHLEAPVQGPMFPAEGMDLKLRLTPKVG